MNEVAQSFPGKVWEHFRATWPLYAAALVTIGFGYWTYCLAFEELVAADGGIYTRWQQFETGQPNAMGDTLAGFVGSLTLIWVVASVIQQSMELKAQRKEFAEMARAQDAQVKALEAQGVLLETQRILLEQDRAIDELNQLLSYICEALEELGGLRHWDLLGKVSSVDSVTGKESDREEYSRIALNYVGSGDSEQKIKNSIRTLRRFKSFFDEPSDKIIARDGVKSGGKSLVVAILPIIEAAMKIRPRLSDMQKGRLDYLNLDSLERVLNDIINLEIWDSRGHGWEYYEP